MFQIGNVIEPAVLLAAVEQAADGIVITDVDAKIEYVNPAFTTMTGYRSDEVVGQNPRMLKSGRHSVTFYEDLWKIVSSGKTWHGEVVNRRKDGSLYNEEMRISPIRDANGVTVRYIAIKHDVTEKRALEERQAFLAAIVENSEDSIIAWSLEGIIVTFNYGAEKIFGYTAKEAIGKHISILVPLERVTDIEKLTQKLLQGNCVSQNEGVCRRKDGREIQVSFSGCAVKNSAGEMIAISNICRDVTQRIKSENAIRDSREFARSTIDALSSHICVLDETGTIIAVNRAWKRFGETNKRVDEGEGSQDAPNGVQWGDGINYLAICDRVSGPDSVEARKFEHGRQTQERRDGHKENDSCYVCRGETRQEEEEPVTGRAEADRRGCREALG